MRLFQSQATPKTAKNNTFIFLVIYTSKETQLDGRQNKECFFLMFDMQVLITKYIYKYINFV